jgi:hypothetical protein
MKYSESQIINVCIRKIDKSSVIKMLLSKEIPFQNYKIFKDRIIVKLNRNIYHYYLLIGRSAYLIFEDIKSINSALHKNDLLKQLANDAIEVII